MLLAYAAFIVTFWLLMSTNIGVLFTQGYAPWLEKLAGMTITELWGVFGLNVTYNPVTSTAFTNAIVSLPVLAFDLFYGLHWTLGFLLNFVWGMVFSQIFNLFYEQFDRAVNW